VEFVENEVPPAHVRNISKAKAADSPKPWARIVSQRVKRRYSISCCGEKGCASVNCCEIDAELHGL
jgi:hypothetical protein